MENPISVLVVDDSVLMRRMISEALNAEPDIEVVDRAFDGAFALKKLAVKAVDVITLDLEMPEMNGIEFLKERLKRGIDTPVIILSSIASRGARVTMQALSLGAADFVLKPGKTVDFRETSKELIELIRVYGRHSGRHELASETLPSRPERPSPPQRPSLVPAPEVKIESKRSPGPPQILAIGVSTGGPNALRTLLPLLDPKLPVPVLVVQHMPAGFTAEFAESLDRICPLDVKEAENGDLLKPGRVLIAPGDRHLEVRDERLAKIAYLAESAPVNGHRPSVSVLFDSVAKHYENRSVAVIMTGMGRDGAEGIQRIYREGGYTLAQDEDSCVVFGMPRVAIELGAIHDVLPPPEIAARINERVRTATR